MKTFWCSLLIFVLLLTVIIVNFNYVNLTAGELLRLTDAIPENPESAGTGTSELSAYWRSHRNGLGMSVSYLELNHVEELIISLQNNCEQGETTDFLRDRALLIPAIEEIRRLEQFRFWNIF